MQPAHRAVVLLSVSALALGGCSGSGSAISASGGAGGEAATGTVSADCPVDQILCGSTCTDLTRDDANCGACGVTCPSPQVCSLGACADTCAAGLTPCGSSCVDTAASLAHCGACDSPCGAGQSCVGGVCTCATAGEQVCDGACVDLQTDAAHCGSCGVSCLAGSRCVGGACSTSATGGAGNTTGGTGAGGATGGTGAGGATGGTGAGGVTGGMATGGAAGGGAAGGVATGGSASGGESTGGATPTGGANTGGVSGSCDPGSTTTTWASGCPTAPPTTCTSGTWVAGGPDPDHSHFTLLSESEHFAVYSDENPSGAQAAVDYLETVWDTYFGSPIYMREPLCDSSTKYKASIHVHSDWGLSGGAWASDRMGMWIGTGGLQDHWGLAHEFTHGAQSVQGGMSCGGSQTENYCGWVYESHANFMAHQMPEYADNVHCSDMLANMPHVYLGSTRDRYCNWQFMEYLKDKYCYSAVNAIWTSTAANDPFTNIMKGQNWDIRQLNDYIGDWAMHNVTWDYQASGAAMRSSYGAVTDTSRPERRLRLTKLEPVDSDWASNRRFQSPYFWAPQRFGYNVAQLYPESGASSVTVTFRGVTQSGANSDWRWGLVAVNGSAPRYSALQTGSDGQLSFCVESDDALYLVVAATPSVQQQIYWDQPYGTLYRYPYMVAFAGAWPEGFQNGTQDGCPSGLSRHSNGGGCAPSGLASSVYVGPHALVAGGTISGNARIEDHAQVLGGTVSDATVGALTIFSNFTVSGSATAQATFYPLDFFEGRSLTGGTLYGDVELRADRSGGTCSGFVDGATCIAPGNEVTAAPPYTWR